MRVGFLRLSIGPDRVRLRSRVKHADRPVKAGDIVTELEDALLCGDQLALQFGSLLPQRGNYMWIGHPYMVGWRPAPLNVLVVALAT
jgi:hypothetical protein